MATILPFKAVRPTRDKVGLFATRTYLSYSKKGLSEKLLNNPFTFLQIINPDFNQKKILKGNQKFELISQIINFAPDLASNKERLESVKQCFMHN